MYLSEEGMSEESCRRRPERQTHTSYTGFNKGENVYSYISDIVIGSGQGAKLTFDHPANGELRKYRICCVFFSLP